MIGSQVDVLVVGAGCAGLSAAIGLARAGVSVAVLEAGVFPGAENWSGCVYFCENLAHPDLLGPDAVESLAWERRLVERGVFLSDGHGLLGMTYREPDAFRHCYTVLRPIFDHHLAQLAIQAGVILLNSTTAESLIRDAGRVIGVATNRGPVYADLTFLAEGDAAHLVAREGYESARSPIHRPSFLHGLKQVIDLPPGGVEANFGLEGLDGAAYEIILRNGKLRGRPVRLNMGGFLYTNRQSISIGLVLPAEHLRENFDGDPNLLLQWFQELPQVARWCDGGTRGVYGARLIRGGGIHDLPTLVDHGLAIGGAATAIGVDFPYPNYTGPATRMGLQIVQAVKAITQAGGEFTQTQLQQHYVEPLRQTRYWKDVEFLSRWPGYVERTQCFFGRNVDVALGTANAWTRPGNVVKKWASWLQVLVEIAHPRDWPELYQDGAQFSAALRFREIAGKPEFGRLLLNGWINAMRDLCGSPRKNVPPAGEARLVFEVPGMDERRGRPPLPMRRWFHRFKPVLAAAAQHVYRNDDTPIGLRLQRAVRQLADQVNFLDVIAAGGLGILTAAAAGCVLVWNRIRNLAGQAVPQGGVPREGWHGSYQSQARHAGDLTPYVAGAARSLEEGLGTLHYLTTARSHIHVHWPRQLTHRRDVARDGLWHVCPAGVYEVRTNPLGQIQLLVNYENCIKCETCWRSSDLVDWGRDGWHRFVYPVGSPVVPLLLAAQDAAGVCRPLMPRRSDPWLPAEGEATLAFGTVLRLVETLELKLSEFAAGLGSGPRTIDNNRAAYLLMLVEYAAQVLDELLAVLRGGRGVQEARGPGERLPDQLMHLAEGAAARIGEMNRQCAQRRYSWAAATGRQVCQHHLAGIRRLCSERRDSPLPSSADPTEAWLQAEHSQHRPGCPHGELAGKIDRLFPPQAWRELEPEGTRFTGAPRSLSADRDAALWSLVEKVPRIEASRLEDTLHPPYRKALLQELGGQDPSMAYRVACHLWARDLADLHGMPPADSWMAMGLVADAALEHGRVRGEALFVPAAPVILLLAEDRLVKVSPSSEGVALEYLPTLGLRGASLHACRLRDLRLAEVESVRVDGAALRRTLQILGGADLTAIASGMARKLADRCVDHATSRVQFPGLFHDEHARDTIGKFGAIKKMVAEMATGAYLLETLVHNLSPTDLSPLTAARAAVLKALVAEILGTAPGSITYNAGQIFGGTGYSEDDILSKFYRDASTWRFLLETNAVIWQRHGESLLAGGGERTPAVSTCAGETALIDQIAQRKALRTELDELRHLRQGVRGGQATIASAGAPPALVCGLARLDALLLASKALLLRTHARLEHGLTSETEMAQVRVWFDQVAVSLAQFEQELKDAPHFQGAGGKATGDLPPTLPFRHYHNFLNATAPYDSGDYLCRPETRLQPRFVPEMVQTDPQLQAWNQDCAAELASFFGPRASGRTPYERYVEQRHRPDAVDLDFCRQHDLFRLPIPAELGGAGRQKVDYYLAVMNAQRLADVSIALTIQVNTSLGTTPILLALQKDLPRARQDLAPFVGDPSLKAEIEERLQRLIESAQQLAKGRLTLQSMQVETKGFEERFEKAVLSRPVLKLLAGACVEAWGRVAACVRSGDQVGLSNALVESLSHWQAACARAPLLLAELPRREAACRLFLRLIACGQISAFGLTEPSAGSDTARLLTRARACSVPVEPDGHGSYRFRPAGGGDPKVVLDASRVEYAADGAYYRFSNEADPARIDSSEYDYESDDAERSRFYLCKGKKVRFTDIATLHERGGKLWYDYWELNGSKMWITNGRMAGVFCMYAKTEEGVTGFLVDRHAEGLIVGKDERKMGQCGSPTNELALESVRVPRENVLGLEGRGQVNALETLNVGRAGLAMSAVASLRSVVDIADQHVGHARNQAGHGPGDKVVAPRLQRLREECYIAESLAFEVIGRLEHPQTKSVRAESAMAKMLVSELLHSSIETAEELLGLEGQTQRRLLEKRKRDARVITIYEGTNEIQRYFILRDLVSEIAPRCVEAVPSEEGLVPNLVREVARRLRSAVAWGGQELWQNPNLQAPGFLLAEAAAWLKAADSVAGRLAWISQQVEPTTMELAHAALLRCAREVRWRLQRFDFELTQLQQGRYPSSVRASTLLFDRPQRAEGPQLPAADLTSLLAVLVVLEPSLAPAPVVQVCDGGILAPYRSLTAADESTLAVCRTLAAAMPWHVQVTVAVAGRPALLPLLREVQAQGMDAVILVETPPEGLTQEEAALRVASVLRERGRRYDLVLGPGGNRSCADGTLAELIAPHLGMPHLGTAEDVTVQDAGNRRRVFLQVSGRREPHELKLPGAVSIEPRRSLPPFSTTDYLASLDHDIQVVPWPADIPATRLHWLAGERSQAVEEVTTASACSPDQAAQRVRAEAQPGSSLPSPVAAAHAFVLAEVDEPNLGSQVAALGVAACEPDGRLAQGAHAVVRNAHAIACHRRGRGVIFLMAPPDEIVQRLAASTVASLGIQDVVIWECPATVGAEPALRGRWLKECWPERFLDAKVVILGESWTETAFTHLASCRKTSRLAIRVRRLLFEGEEIQLETAHAEGKLRAWRPLDTSMSGSWWIAQVGDAEPTPVQGGSDGPVKIRRCQLWRPAGEHLTSQPDFKQLIASLEQAIRVDRLSEAEFIIDVGFGIKNQDGFEEVVLPLRKTLEAIGVRKVMIGGSRKVTEELHLLPTDRQIGQSGVRVNPRILLAIGISGAPQHLQYIGPRAVIVAFNRDPEAPIMRLNRRQPRPQVLPVVGDLFETVPAFTSALAQIGGAG